MRIRGADFIVESDYRCWVLRGELDEVVTDAPIPANSLVHADIKLTQLMIQTGSQHGPFKVHVEHHDSAPPEAEPAWDDVVELEITVAGDLAVCDLIDGPVGTVITSPGRSRLRICASDRPACDDFDDWPLLPDEPVSPSPERYLLQVWPAPVPTPPAVVRDSGQRRTQRRAPADVPAAAPGSWDPMAVRARLDAAIVTISDALDAPDPLAHLSGRATDVNLTAVLPGTPRGLFDRLYGLCVFEADWPSAGGGLLEVGDHEFAASPWHRPGLTGARGYLLGIVTDLKVPTMVEKSWNWYLPPEDHLRPVLGGGVAVLPRDTRVRTTLSALPGKPRRTEVSITHGELPVEWAEAMTLWWQSRMDKLATWQEAERA